MPGSGVTIDAIELGKTGLHVFCLAEEKPLSTGMHSNEIHCDMADFSHGAPAIRLAIPLGDLVGPAVVAFGRRGASDLEDGFITLLPGLRELGPVDTKRVLLEATVGQVNPPGSEQRVTLR